MIKKEIVAIKINIYFLHNQKSSIFFFINFIKKIELIINIKKLIKKFPDKIDIGNIQNKTIAK